MVRFRPNPHLFGKVIIFHYLCDMFKNTNKQGNWGLGAAIAYFTEKGYTVCVPLTDSQEYDLIVDIDNKIYRVQVKSTTYKGKKGSYKISLTTKGGNRSFNTIKHFNGELVDYIFAITKDGDKYFIPTSCATKSTISLGKKYEIFKV